MDKRELEALLTPILEQESAELVDLNYAKEGPRWVVRVFVDKPGGVTLDDCAYLSDRLGAMIDESKAIERSYVLEVSSPGLDRVIKKEKDFIRFAGRAVTVRLKVPEQGRRNFKGVLKGFEGGKVLFEADGALLSLAPELLDEMRLDYRAEV